MNKYKYLVFGSLEKYNVIDRPMGLDYSTDKMGVLTFHVSKLPHAFNSKDSAKKTIKRTKEKISAYSDMRIVTVKCA